MILIILTLLINRICTEELLGFHFHPDRKYAKAHQKLREHRKDPNSTFMFDLETEGYCARIDVKPFILPSKLTVCYKSNHDFIGTFIFLSLLSTKSGNSLVDDFKNKTYREMKGEGGLMNLITVFKDHGWGGMFHQVGNKTQDTNGLTYPHKRYGWKRWEQWCAAFDMEVGQVITYVDGLFDGAGVDIQHY